MKTFTLVAALLCTVAMALPAAAERPFDTSPQPVPAKPPIDILTFIYNTSPALLCYYTARDGTNLKDGLDSCNVAFRDPLESFRAETLVNRGIVLYDLGNKVDAMADFNSAIALNPGMGEAYLNRAMVLIADKQDSEAMDAINKGISLGATNLEVAYFRRGQIEDDKGQYALAYRDYQQALTLKPDFAPASRELQRFRVVPPGSSGT
jgi:tetratricopeptide (TPR) repeat protein